MSKKYVFPKDFDPRLAVYALKGIAGHLHDYYAEGDGIYRTVPAGDHASLLGLSWLQRRVTQELADYLGALDAAGLGLPVNQRELDDLERKVRNEVREEPGIYLVRSN